MWCKDAKKYYSGTSSRTKFTGWTNSWSSMVMKLFVCHPVCEFNPMELAWGKWKHIICEKSVDGEFSLQACSYEQLRQSILLHAKTGKGYVGVFENCRKEYWQRDFVMEATVHEFVIDLGNHSDSSCLSQLLWTYLNGFCFGQSVCHQCLKYAAVFYCRRNWSTSIFNKSKF